MARLFAATGDVINYGTPAPLQDLTTMTLACWARLATAGGGGAGRLLDKTQLAFACVTGPLIDFTRLYSTTNLSVRSSSGSVTFNQYSHIAVTWNGGTTASTSVVIYIDGSAVGSYSLQQNAVGSLTTDASNAFCVGNRAAGARNADGRLAECAVWSAVLSAAEIASLAKGFSAKRIKPQNRLFYAPLIRDFPDLVGGIAGTLTGATVADHPRVY